MKKVIILVLIAMLTGCSSAVPTVEQKERLTGADYAYTDFSIYSDEEIDIRSTFEFDRIYLDSLKDYPTGLVSKYGIDDYWQYGDMFWFSEPKHMETVLNNSDFIEEHADQYDATWIQQYYLPKINITRYFGIYILASSDDLYFNVHGYSIENEVYTDWSVYISQEKYKLEDILEFYAALDDLTIQNAKSKKGVIIYYVPVENSTLMGAIGVLPSEKPYTAYFWEQDNVIGVLVMPGEFSEANLEQCVLEQHEI